MATLLQLAERKAGEPCYSRNGLPGFRLKPDAQPVGEMGLAYGARCAVYKKSDFLPKQKRSKRNLPVALPPTPDNILRAAWTVNRTAKRFRDAAASCYDKQTFAFASVNRAKKENCYALKDKAMLYLIANGILTAEYRVDALTLWRGGGYTFHSLYSPETLAEDEERDTLTIEAKPKGARELRLMDAEATIKALPDVMPSGLTLNAFEPRRKCRDEPRDYWGDEEDEDDDDYVYY